MGAMRRSVGAFVLSARTTSAIAADIPHWGPFSTNWVFGVQGMIDVGASIVAVSLIPSSPFRAVR